MRNDTRACLSASTHMYMHLHMCTSTDIHALPYRNRHMHTPKKKERKAKTQIEDCTRLHFANASLTAFESRIHCMVSTVYALSPYEVLMKMDLIDWNLCPAAMLIVATLWCCVAPYLSFVCLMLSEMREEGE